MSTARSGDEGRRQAYLAALGIPLWSARFELPGALPASPLDYVPYITEPPVAAPADLPDLPEPAPPEPAAVRESVPQAMPPRRAGEPAPGPGPGSPATSPSPAAAARAEGPVQAPRPPASTPAADERFPRLACRVRPLRRGVTAVIALDDAPDLSGAEYQLLGSIARALGADGLPEGTGETLRWPLNRNPAMDHGTAAMHAWLAHALRLPAGGCLVFGEALAAHVRAALPEQRLRVAPTLAEMLADSGAKRRLLAVLADVLPAPKAVHD